MIEIIFDRSLGLPCTSISINENLIASQLRRNIEDQIAATHLVNGSLDFYLLQNGKLIHENALCKGAIYVVPRICGGKGGFGSMLRAIGAQIEKTTNREACRDLSGRRLRDINEEKRLKKWIAEQAEREREAAERKKKKLERLQAEPKHEFSDPNYDKARSELIEKVHDAVEEGIKVASTTSSEPSTSASSSSIGNQKKIKGTLWMDELEGLDSEDDTESETETEARGDLENAKVNNQDKSSNGNQVLDSNSDNRSNIQIVRNEQSNKRTESDVNEENEEVSPAKKMKTS